jgi:hypothetical protein
VSLVVTTGRLARFFREVGAVVGDTDLSPDAAVAEFLATSSRFGHWNATPRENAEVGIVPQVRRSATRS